MQYKEKVTIDKKEYDVTIEEEETIRGDEVKCNKIFLGVSIVVTIALFVVVLYIINKFYNSNELKATSIGEYITIFYIFAGVYLVYQIIKAFNTDEKRTFGFWIDKSFFVLLLLGIFFIQFSILLKVNTPKIIDEINNTSAKEFIDRKDYNKLIKSQTEDYKFLLSKINDITEAKKELVK